MGQCNAGCGLCGDDDLHSFNKPTAATGAANIDPTLEEKSVLRIAVVRHGERADQAAPKTWFRSMLGKRYPFDPPLTLAGTKQAKTLGKELLARYNGEFSMVISSPFIRCIETAVEICRVFGVSLCVDRELGEIFSPVYFGAWDPPGPPLRTAEEIAAYIPNDVRIAGVGDDGKLTQDGFVGNPPVWPEKSGKVRLASRVEALSEKAVKLGGAGFILVTHGDCVAGCLALGLVSQRNESMAPTVTKVPYCGYVVLERPFSHHEEPVGLLDADAGWSVHNGHNEVTDPQGPDLSLWNPAHDKKVEQLNNFGSQLAQMRKEADTKPLLRRPTTKILSSDLLTKKATKVLEAQQEVGVAFSQLVPSFPRDRQVTREHLKELSEYAPSEAV